jgi:two-component system chemotaxis response regulator CheB
VTLDLEMPVMGGLEAIERIMAQHPVPILVITAASGAGTAFAAVTRGAMDLIPKPDLRGKGRELFIQKVRHLAGANMGAFLSFRGMRPPPVAQAAPAAFSDPGGRVLAIAASTGGPQALQAILSRLDPGFPAPVVVAQHVGEGFCRGLADWLGGTTPLEVKEAAPGEALARGRVYLNPPDSAMRISIHGSVILAERDGKNRYRPSCDTLLQSVAEVYGRRSIGLILSGMGDDGVRGMLAIRKAGGATLAQDEATSVVYGMNGAAVEAGAVEWTLPLGDIPAHLRRLALEARQVP